MASLLGPLLFFVALALATAAWRDVLRRRMPAYARLPANLQLQLKKHTQVLLAEKPFIGCAGLVVTTEMRVLIAAQAALLLLNRRADYFPKLRQILLYPGAFAVDRSTVDGSGLTHDTRRALSGESWQHGQVLLSWDDVLAGATDPAEFFAVISEHFFEQAALLATAHPALYGELVLCYRTDPLNW